MALYKKILLFVPLLALFLAITAPTASADTYSLNLDACTGTCGGGPYGTVDVTQFAANQVKILVTLNAGVKFVKTGAGSFTAFGFNIQPPAVDNPTIGVSISSPGSPVLSLLSTTAGAISYSAFGNMEYAIRCAGCSNGGAGIFAGPLEFIVSASGLTPVSFAQLSTGSTKAFFTADISGTNGLTGVVGATKSTTRVPEPASLLTLGFAIVGFGFATKKLRS